MPANCSNLTQRTARVSPWIAPLLLLFVSSKSSAQPHVALPPVNLGGSSFMEGQGGPGLLAHEAPGGFQALRFTDPNGSSVPGRLSAFTSITHLGYSPPLKILGGYWGAEVLLPIAFLEVSTPQVHASTWGIGDATVSPLVFQLPNVKVLGRSVFQRFDADVVVPTGQYRRAAPLNTGSHVWSVNPYYAITILLTDRLETSWRLHYLWNSSNRDPGDQYAATSIQPGQAIHFNGAVSVAVTSYLRAGVATYFLTQISDAKIGGRAVPNSRERVAGLGPGLLVTQGTLSICANTFAELGVVNRPAGERFNVSAIKVW